MGMKLMSNLLILAFHVKRFIYGTIFDRIDNKYLFMGLRRPQVFRAAEVSLTIRELARLASNYLG
jgi:hypothetical protein